MLRLKFMLLLLLPVLWASSCKEEILPKPKAQLRLEYAPSTYESFDPDCPFGFERAIEAKISTDSRCWVNIEYPRLRVAISMTYRPVENNLQELLQEAEKLTFNHAIKADGISSRPYANADKRVYGSVFEVTGNAASPIQFHVTDSTAHFITAAVYFNVQPNYDSIKPAIEFLQKDIVHLIESLEWKEDSQK